MMVLAAYESFVDSEQSSCPPSVMSGLLLPGSSVHCVCCESVKVKVNIRVILSRENGF